MNSPKKPRNKRPRDLAQLAQAIVLGAAGESEILKPPKKDPAAQSRGSKGGAARHGVLSESRRKEIAKKAAKARWQKS
jgi:hypothetical protein